MSENRYYQVMKVQDFGMSLKMDKTILDFDLRLNFDSAEFEIKFDKHMALIDAETVVLRVMNELENIGFEFMGTDIHMNYSGVVFELDF